MFRRLETDLENATQPSDFDVLLFIKLHHVVNPVFVDCTSAESTAGLYARALKEGFHVVTPNKKANTRELAITMSYVKCSSKPT